MGARWGRLRENECGCLQRIKILLGNGVRTAGDDGAEAARAQNESMWWHTGIGRREKLMIFYNGTRVGALGGGQMLLKSRTELLLWFKEILFGNFTSSDQKEPVQYVLFCQPAGFMAGHWVDTEATLKSTNRLDNEWLAGSIGMGAATIIQTLGISRKMDLQAVSRPRPATLWSLFVLFVEVP